MGFRSILGGTLDERAKMMRDEMCIAVGGEIAKVAEEKGLNEDRIIPSMSDWKLFPREAAAVGAKAVKQGLARTRLTKKELYDKAVGMISHARKSTELLMRRGLIKSLPQSARRRRR